MPSFETHRKNSSVIMNPLRLSLPSLDRNAETAFSPSLHIMNFHQARLTNTPILPSPAANMRKSPHKTRHSTMSSKIYREEEEEAPELQEPQPFDIPYHFPAFKSQPIKKRTTQRPEYKLKAIKERLPSRKEVKRLIRPVKTETRFSPIAGDTFSLNLGVNAGCKTRNLGGSVMRSASLAKFETIGF